MLATIKGTFLGSKSGVTKDGNSWVSTDIYTGGECKTIFGIDFTGKAKPMVDTISVDCNIYCSNGQLRISAANV